MYNNLHSKLAVPTIMELMSSTKEKPLDWVLELNRYPNQSKESIAEKIKALRIGMKRIKM